MKNFKMTIHYVYEYDDEFFAIEHKKELIANGLKFVEMHKNKQENNWLYRYEQEIN